jgi:hypothetical protein
LREWNYTGHSRTPFATDKYLHIVRLTTVKSALSIRERAPDPPLQCLPRRQGSVLETVTSVLADAAEPLRVRDIHTAVEELLGSLSRTRR